MTENTGSNHPQQPSLSGWRHVICIRHPAALGPARAPSVDELRELIEAALKHVPAHRLWINPDCGLKTCDYPEVRASLANLVAARQATLESVPVTV